MTPSTFRRLALALPFTEERSHMGHPDFRVGGRGPEGKGAKIFATLGSPKEGWAMVKLPPAHQAQLIAAAPDVYVPATGAWGRQGCTHVLLAAADKQAVKTALEAAWQQAAPKGVVQGLLDPNQPTPTRKVRPADPRYA